MRNATSHAPAAEMPQKIPSSAAMRRVIRSAAAWLTFSDAGYLRSVFRLRADNPNVSVFLLQVLRHAHDGSGRPHCAHEVRDLAIRIAPYFRPRSLVMRA